MGRGDGGPSLDLAIRWKDSHVEDWLGGGVVWFVADEAVSAGSDPALRVAAWREGWTADPEADESPDLIPDVPRPIIPGA